MQATTKSRPIVWAHRGASGYEVDNTIEAFDLALEQGADGLESDVRRTRDGHLVFFHDDWIVDGGKRVRPESLSLLEIRCLDLGGGRAVPEVRTTLLRYRGKLSASGNTFLFSLDVLPPAVGVQLVQILRDIDMTSQVIVTPSDADPGYRRAVRRIRETVPSARLVRTASYSALGWLARHLPGRGGSIRWSRLRALGFEGINIRAQEATQYRIDAARRRGFSVYVWDCHDEATMRDIIRLEVDAMYTNYPDVLVSLLSRDTDCYG